MNPASQTADQTNVDDSCPGLRHLVAVTCTMLACVAVTYAVPSLHRVRPWLPGEDVPIVHLFQSTAPSLATGPGDTHSTQGPQHPAPIALAPAVVPDGQQQAVGADSPPAVRIDPAEYAELPQPIEYADNLAAFYAALRRTAERQPGAITRVAHYGDSAVAADGVTSTARRLMQQRFGDAGHGFILTARGDMHYLHRDIRMRSGGEWELRHIVRGPLRNGWYGYGGVQYRGAPGASATFETPEETPIGRAASRFELFFQKAPGGGDIRVSVDGESSVVLPTRADRVEDAFHTVSVPDGAHSFSIRVQGRGVVTMYGVALERDVPGVVYDSLGLVGARAQRLLNADAAHMRRQIEHRSPDLVVLAFGGNESGDPRLQPDAYKAELREVIRVMRGNRAETSCLLFAPLDQGRKNARGVVETVPVLHTIVAAQAEVARTEGCAFFNAFAAMGGEGAMGRWYRARPRLASSDLRHATPEGYEVMGGMYYKALIKGFADFLAKAGN